MEKPGGTEDECTQNNVVSVCTSVSIFWVKKL